MLLHVKQLGQVEYLWECLFGGKTFELTKEAEVVEEREAFFQVILLKTHTHLIEGKLLPSQQVFSLNQTNSSEVYCFNSCKKINELGFPLSVGPRIAVTEPLSTSNLIEIFLLEWMKSADIGLERRRLADPRDRQKQSLLLRFTLSTKTAKLK